MTLQTEHRLICGDARHLSFIPDTSVHLVVTSPPYWTLKDYNPHPDQMGHIEDYEGFPAISHDFLKILIPACLSRAGSTFAF